MLSPQTSQRLLYVGVALNAFAIYKHTQLGFSNFFPRFDAAMGPGNPTAFTAKIGFLVISASFATSALLQLKWAQGGVRTGYDRVLLAWYALYKFGFGLAYWSKGMRLPLVPLWGAAGVTVLSQL